MALLGVLEMLEKQAAADVQHAAEGAALPRRAVENQAHQGRGAMLGRCCAQAAGRSQPRFRWWVVPEGAAVAGRAAEKAGMSGTWCNVGPLLRAGRGQFTAALEVVEAERLVMSFLHHMALQRQCRNPFEKGDIAGITNYLDVGLQVLPESEQPARIMPCKWCPQTTTVWPD